MRKLVRVFLASIFVAAVFCVLASPSPTQAQDQLDWQSNVPVNSTGTINEWYPKIGTSRGPNAGTFAVWMDTANRIYADYRPKGGDWGGDVVINDAALGGYRPAISVDSAGNAYVIWAGIGGIYSTVLPPGGGWDPDTLVRTKLTDQDAEALPYADIAVDSAGNVHAVWYDRRLESGNLFSDFRTAGGGWGTDTPVNDIWGSLNAPGSHVPSITADDAGNVYVAWTDGRNGPQAPYFAYRNQGGAWSANEQVKGPSGGEPDIAVDAAGNVYVLWTASENIAFNYRPAGGGFTLETVEQLNDDTNLALQGAATIGVDSGGNAYAVWSDRRNGFSDIFDDIYSAYRPAGGSWGANILINDDGGGYPTQTYPDLAVDSDGYAQAVWMDMRNENWDIYFSTTASEPKILRFNLPIELTVNQETGWYNENPIEFKVKVTNITETPFSGRIQVDMSNTSRLSVVDSDMGGHPFFPLHFLFYSFDTLNPGQDAENTWSLWVKPRSAETILFTVSVYDDGDQLIDQKTASMFVPKAEIYPVVILPGWPGSFINSKGEWEIDPIKGTYNHLLEELQLAGYEKDVSLFTFPYDWRRDANKNAEELGEKIATFSAKASSSGKEYIKPSQVDLVGHSGGGLVSRAYIQGSNYGNNVHRLITLGTPHRGTPKSYLAAEGLEFDFLNDIGDEIGPILAKEIIRFLAWKHDYCTVLPILTDTKCSALSLHHFIKEEAPSVRQAFPTDDYLHDDPGGYLIYSDEPPTIFPFLHQYNGFLTTLNNNVSLLTNRLGANNTISVVGVRSDEDTDKYYKVSERNLIDRILGLWENGVVGITSAFRIQGTGDGTVPQISADLSLVNESIRSEIKMEGDDKSEIKHGNMPTQLQQSIVELLTDARPKFDADFIDPEMNVKKGLIIFLLSPAELQVTDPNGRRAGLDFSTGIEFTEIPGAFFSRSNLPDEPDFIFIPETLEGDYQINLLGTDEGDYRVVMQALGEQDVLTLADFSGSTTPGQEHEHLANYDSEAIPQTPLSLEWLPPLENPDEPYEVAQNEILPISFKINDALGEFLGDDSVSVWIEDPSDPPSVVASITGDTISIDPQEEKYSVDLHLSDYSFSLDTTYIVHASLYGEELGATTFTVKSNEVGIDIWPGLKQNFIVFSRRLNHPIGIVPIAILSTPDFYTPDEVDQTSLTFGKTGDEYNPYYCLRRDRDYNNDGLKDLLCFFTVSNTGIEPGDVEAIIKGQTNDGYLIEGQDSVQIVIIR